MVILNTDPVQTSAEHSDNGKEQRVTINKLTSAIHLSGYATSPFKGTKPTSTPFIRKLGATNFQDLLPIHLGLRFGPNGKPFASNVGRCEKK
jgi:hypothetical protein